MHKKIKRNYTTVDKKSKKKYRYLEVYEDLVAKVSQGDFPLNEMLPSEKEIGKIYSVERTTVRKALELLVNDGFVQKFQGLGAKVVSTEKVQMASSNLKKSDTILFFLPKTSDNVDRLTQPYYSLMFFNLERELKRNGYKTIYSTISASDNIEDLLKQQTYAGIIFASYGVDEKHLQYVSENNIPYVTVNNDYESAVSIVPDNYMGGYLAGKHLVELGHCKIGLITGNPKDMSCRQRLAGFTIALSESGLHIDDKYVRNASWLAENAIFQTKDLLEKNKNDLPTAIFAFNDEMALSAMRVLNEMGYNVPEDVSLVGFDNISQAKYIYPELTTIDSNVEMISKTAVWILNNKIRKDVHDNFKILVPVQLMKRGSTAFAK
jgi:LacI family transcriptional regulator